LTTDTCSSTWWPSCGDEMFMSVTRGHEFRAIGAAAEVFP
jgi:hypothetical protein